jgi:hypothetical protein
MTAGSGVVHREMPSAKVQRDGGRVHGFQLWVNLPRALKGVGPRYQEMPAARIPEATSPDGRAHVRVIAGEALGVSAVTATHTPILYQHWRLDAGASIALPVPADHRVGVYVFDGVMEVAGTQVRAGQFAVLGPGDTLQLSAALPAQALVLGGRPIGEPIAWGGPFVMNTREEVMQAFADFRAGKMGRIPPEIVRA